MFLVTGGSGFIGSHLLERLSTLGQPVRALVRRNTALPAGVEPAFGDLITGEGVGAAVAGATTIIHAAGVIKALAAGDYYAGNVRATELLARASAGAARFVHVSSLAAIGPSRDGIPVLEDAEPHPLTHYGKSKLEAERVLRKLLPDAVIVRPAVVYGPRDTGVFPILQSLSKGLRLEIGGGERWFSAIYVADLVEALLAAAQVPGAAGRDYFAAHPKPASWADFGATAARIMSRRPHVLRVPPAMAYAVGWCAEMWSQAARSPSIISREKITEARATHWTCDTGRAARELGFSAGTPLETGLASTLAWYKEAGWLNY